MKKILLIAAVVFLAACEPQPHHFKTRYPHSERVHEYRYHKSDDSFMYLYVIQSTLNNSTSYYYTSSSAPITNFNSANFISSGSSLPADVTYTVEGAEQISEIDLSDSMVPDVVEHDLATEEANFTEYAETTDAPVEAGGDSGGDSGGGGD